MDKNAPVRPGDAALLRTIWAKSPRRGQARGEFLTTHLITTRDAVRVIGNRVGQIPVAPDGFWRWAELAGLLHDTGKIPSGFQHMVGNPGPGQPWGQRHEVYSLGFVAHVLAALPADDQNWIALGVATHHRPITGTTSRSLEGKLNVVYTTPERLIAAIGPVDAQIVRALHAWLTREAGCPPSPPAEPAAIGASAHRLLDDLVRRWDEELEDDAALGLVGVLLQGAVTMADHVASQHGALLVRPPIDALFQPRVLRNGATPRPHQHDAGKVDGHLLLRAPTGSGKTEGALLWAGRQVDAIHRERAADAPRIFYTLPYLASIDAMAIRLGDEIGDPDGIGVAHSRAASYHLARASCADDDDERIPAAEKAVSRAKATRLFRETVRVGTPYQLMRAALAGTAHSGSLLDATNSVFILDELHAYDTQRLGMLIAMLGLWERLGGHIAVISATLPHRLERLVNESLGAAMTTIEPSDRPVPRHRLRPSDDHLTSPTAISAITERLDHGEAVLVVANNVPDARFLYEQLAVPARRAAGGDEDAALLLHARFRRRDRSEIERRIRDRYATGSAHRAGLLIATQVVEVSLDVDFDVLHTSGAPLEALLQRFGRVNRLGARPPADVVVHAPDYRRRRGSPELFADGIYEAEPTRLSSDIVERHADEDVDETTTIDWLDEIYDSAWGDQWHHDVDGSRTRFAEHFLTFAPAFHDRSELADDFDAMFDGVEAVLADDVDAYRSALNSSAEVTNSAAVGRLLAADYLVPLPNYAARRAQFDRALKVSVVNAEYDPELGLIALRDADGPRHILGEVL